MTTNSPRASRLNLLPSTASIGGNDTSLVNKADPSTGAPKEVPDTSGLPYCLGPMAGY